MAARGIVQLAPGAVFANDFRIVKPLSEGGMGAVYVVEQISTRKRRALKLMLPNLVADAKLRQRFEQEAQVGASIESEHVIEVVGAGVDAATGAPWLAMELLDGGDLSELVARTGPLPLDEVRRILEELCHAIGAAHAAGIVHRDLKPENIFLAKTKRAGVKSTVKVLDFGIAKIAAEAKTTATAAVGSPMWMSPEQTARGGAIGPPTDVWAIGLITFHLLTGRFFWRAAEEEGGTLANLLREVVLDPILAASERAAEVGCGDKLPPGFDEWFARAVDRDPRRRFANARETFAAFESGCGGAAVRTRSTQAQASLAAAPTMNDPSRGGVPEQPSQGSGAFVPGRASSTTAGVANATGTSPAAAQPGRVGAVILALVGSLTLIVGAGAVGWVVLHGRQGASAAAEVTTAASAPPALVSARGPERTPATTATVAAPVVPAAVPTAVPAEALHVASSDSKPPQTAAPSPPLPRSPAVSPVATHVQTPVAQSAPPTPTPAEPDPAAGPARPFDRHAARLAFLKVAPAVARCRSPDAPGVIPSVKPSARVVFAPGGNVVSVDLDDPLGGTPIGDCVEAAIRPVVVPPFDGPPVTIVKGFRFE